MMRSVFIILLLCASSAAHAQLDDPRLPISLDADKLDTDIDSSLTTFSGLRLNQGAMSIEADTGQASDLNFNDSVWRLSGNVVIVVDSGRIECDAADLEFSDNQLKIAAITGQPATFTLTRLGSEEATYAQAEILRYDLDAGTIEFSGDARIVEGGNQIASGFLVYNIGEQRIMAQGSDEEDGKVKITFTPSEPDETDEDDGDEPQ